MNREALVASLTSAAGVPVDPSAFEQAGLAAGRDDPRVVAAHRLLESIDPCGTPPLDSIVVMPLREDGTWQLAGQAVDDAVLVSPRVAAYRDGGLALALLLRHEHLHVLYPDWTESRVRTSDMRFARRIARDGICDEHFVLRVCRETLAWAERDGDAALRDRADAFVAEAEAMLKSSGLKSSGLK